MSKTVGIFIIVGYVVLSIFVFFQSIQIDMLQDNMNALGKSVALNSKGGLATINHARLLENDVNRIKEDIGYLYNAADHQAQIDNYFFQRIDYLLEEANYPGGPLYLDPSAVDLMLYRGKD